MSAFLLISTAVEALLTASPALAGGTVRRGRRVALARGQSQGVDIYLQHSAGQRQMIGNPVLWTTSIGIGCKARGAVAQDGDDAIDLLLMAVYARLAGAALQTQAPTAGIVDTGMDPHIAWEVEEAESVLVTASLTLTVTHLAQSLTLAAWP